MTDTECLAWISEHAPEIRHNITEKTIVMISDSLNEYHSEVGTNMLDQLRDVVKQANKENASSETD